MENWRGIPGYEGIYEASDMGRIRTCEGKTTSNALYPLRIWKQRVLKQRHQKRKGSKKTDARVSLWKNGMESTHLVSRLVAMAWCPGFEQTSTVNHIDGNPENNRAGNLEWVTLTENIQKGFECGLYKTQKPVDLIGKDGTVVRFRSMACASRYLGKNSGYISCLIKRGAKATQEGYRIELRDER